VLNHIPIPRPSVALSARFFTHVLKTDGCWIWTGAKNRDGYGEIKVGKSNLRAHRLSYAMINGDPAELVIDHLCRNRACVKPNHLEAVTNRVNIKRGLAANGGPGRNPATTCKQGHAFTAENSIAVPKGKRCRECSLAYKKAKYQERKAAALSS